VSLNYKESGKSLANEMLRLLGNTNASDVDKSMVLLYAKLYLDQSLNLPTKHGEIKFNIANEMSLKRGQTLLTKEPETIEWIDSFDENDTMWDIGANVGVYSLYAAARGIKTLSFEPSSANYYLLNKNIELNKFDDLISAYCLALSDASEIGSINMINLAYGGALHSFSNDAESEKFSHGAFTSSIDDFISQYNISVPTHIKIDVDGLEGPIVRGATKTFASEKLKSVLIELDTDSKEEMDTVLSVMEASGLELIHVGEPNEYEGKNKFIKNHIFKRN